MSVSPTMKASHVAAKAAAEPVANPNDDGHDHSSAMTARKVVRPSPTIHEDTINRHYGTDPVSRDLIPDAAISRMADAVASARRAAEQSGRVAEAIYANEMMTEPARHRATKDKTWRLVEGALADVDSAMQNAKRELERLDAGTRSPAKPTDAAGAVLASEIRQRLASLPPADRAKALAAALADGDETVVSAIVNAPSMLSGMTAVEREAFRHSWRAKRWAPELARIERLKAALADTERAGTLSLSFINSLSSDAIVQRAEESERRVTAALNS